MLSNQEKLLIEKRVAEFAIAITDAVASGDEHTASNTMLSFYDFLCRAFTMAKVEGKMMAIGTSFSNN